jgi:hypothetical protein
MQALSYRNEVDHTPETGTLTFVYDRVRRSIDLGLIKKATLASANLGENFSRSCR